MKSWLVVLVSSLVLVLAACSTAKPPTPVAEEELPAGSETSQEADIRKGYYLFPGDDKPSPVTFEVVNGLAIYQGDMILGAAKDILEGLAPQGLVVNSSKHWSDGVVPYTFGETINESKRDLTLSAIEHIQDKTVVRFVEHTPANAARYPNFVEITTGNYYDYAWETTFGKLEFIRDLNGDVQLDQDGVPDGALYGSDDGRLINLTAGLDRGYRDGKRVVHEFLIGNWVQKSSERRCATAINGTYYWGQFTMIFSDDFGMIGKWSYCDEKLPEEPNWTGSTGTNWCAASVGMVGGRQKLTLPYNSCQGERNKGVVIHELGHVLGLQHEQSRSDRDTYVSIITPHIQFGMRHNFEKANGSSDYGPYDYDSIMHYGATDFGVYKGAVTILPKNDVSRDRLGQRKGLSAGDIAAVNRAYSADTAYQGDWDTSFGSLNLYRYDANSVVGTYPEHNGKAWFPYYMNETAFRATTIPAQAAKLDGYWIQPNSSVKCDSTIDGSYYWGRVEFNVDTDNLKFTGKWGYCDSTPTSAWDGERVGAN